MSWSHLGCRDLRTIDLTAFQLVGADFSGTNMDFATFRSANLSDANLQGTPTSCRNARFDDAFLAFSKWERTDATGSTFDGANLQEVAMDDAILNFASFVGADLRDAKLIGVRAAGASFRDASLREADFSGAHLVNVSFDGADVSMAIFVDSNLKGATFVGALGFNLADFDGAHGLYLGTGSVP